MYHFVTQLFTRSHSSLAKRLQSYEPYQLPHSLEGNAINIEQANANLEYFLEARFGRIVRLVELFHEEGLVFVNDRWFDDPDQLLAGLDEWVRRTWPALPRPKQARQFDWLSSQRDGPDIVFSMLADIAILLGELIIYHCPDFAWCIYADEDDVDVVYWHMIILRRMTKSTSCDSDILWLDAIIHDCFRSIKSSMSPSFTVTKSHILDIIKKYQLK